MFKPRIPILLCVARQGLGFARHCEDLTARFVDAIHDAIVLVATQLAATRRSPEASVEDEHDERVFLKDVIQPTRSHAGGRVEQGRGRSDLGTARSVCSIISEMGHVESIGIWLDLEALSQAYFLPLLMTTQDELQLACATG